MVYLIRFKLLFNSPNPSIIRITFFTFLLTPILYGGCSCLCDDPQPEPYQIAFQFKDSSSQYNLEDHLGEEIRLFLFDESGNRELAKTWEINELTVQFGQVDYFYSSRCEEYQQFFEIEFLENMIPGSFKVRPFYEKKTCCSKHCFSGIIYDQEIQDRITTIIAYSGPFIFFEIYL